MKVAVEDLSADVGRFLDGERVLAHHEELFERARRFFTRYQAPILIVAAYLVDAGGRFFCTPGVKGFSERR